MHKLCGVDIDTNGNIKVNNVISFDEFISSSWLISQDELEEVKSYITDIWTFIHFSRNGKGLKLHIGIVTGDPVKYHIGTGGDTIEIQTKGFIGCIIPPEELRVGDTPIWYFDPLKIKELVSEYNGIRKMG